MVRAEAWKTAELQAATTITAAETAIGGEIDVSNYENMTVYLDYTKGDETSLDIIPKVLRKSGDDEHQYCTWGSGGTKTVTQVKFQLTATGKYYLKLDITGLQLMKIYGDATGGTPTGTVQLGYTLSNN